jgi:hypothetical protein
MKKLLTALFALSVSAAAFADQKVGPAAPYKLDATSHNLLVYVYNPDAVAHENGDVVVWYDGSLVDGLEVSTTTSASNKLVAGIVYPDTIAAQSWGTVMVYGYHPAINIGVANSAGDCLGTSTTAEVTGITTTAGACVATALEATTSSTTVKGFVHRM